GPRLARGEAASGAEGTCRSASSRRPPDLRMPETGLRGRHSPGWRRSNGAFQEIDRSQTRAEAVEKLSLRGGEAADAARADLVENPVELVAVDLVELVALDFPPSLHRPAGRLDLGRGRLHLIPKPPHTRGRAALDPFEIPISAEEPAEVGEVRDAATAA